MHGRIFFLRFLDHNFWNLIIAWYLYPDNALTRVNISLMRSPLRHTVFIPSNFTEVHVRYLVRQERDKRAISVPSSPITDHIAQSFTIHHGKLKMFSPSANQSLSSALFLLSSQLYIRFMGCPLLPAPLSNLYPKPLSMSVSFLSLQASSCELLNPISKYSTRPTRHD